MELNWQHIIYFLKAAESANLSEAARKCFVSSQALNKQLVQLEESVGEKLIERRVGSGKGMQLTSTGKMMRDCFMPSYKELKKGTAKFEKYMESRKRILSIGYFRNIEKNELLLPTVERLLKEEDIENVQLGGGELGEVLEWVMEEKCDVGITNIHETEQKRPGIVYIPLATIPACIFVSEKHPWAKKDVITKEDMAEATLLVIPWKEELEKDCFWKKVDVKQRKEVRDTESMMMEAKTGEYFAVTAEYMGKNDSCLVKKQLPKEYQFDFEYCIIYKEGSICQKYFAKEKNQL